LHEAGRPLIITQNGKPAGVVLSPVNYDELVYRKSFLIPLSEALRTQIRKDIYDAGNKEKISGAKRQ